MRLLVLVLAVLGLAGPLHAQDARSGPAATLERIVADIREARQLAKSSPSAGTREQFDLRTMSFADWTEGRVPSRQYSTNAASGERGAANPSIKGRAVS